MTFSRSLGREFRRLARRVTLERADGSASASALAALRSLRPDELVGEAQETDRAFTLFYRELRDLAFFPVARHDRIKDGAATYTVQDVRTVYASGTPVLVRGRARG